MDSRVIYETWAPPGGPWSPWAKPVLFAHLPGSVALPPVELPELRPDTHATKPVGKAMVVDLPGLDSIGLGLELVGIGFRPVPLFNACPAPESLLGERGDEVVPTARLLSALLEGTGRLQSAGLPLDAPPAFLLDADRHGPGQPIVPGRFDNRWGVFATDFPSADFLNLRGIRAVEVVHQGPLLGDLVDVLRLWQRGEIALSHIDLQSTDPTSTNLDLPMPWWAGFTRVARRLWVLLSLRRNPQGGFGGFVPEASSSGG